MSQYTAEVIPAPFGNSKESLVTFRPPITLSEAAVRLAHKGDLDPYPGENNTNYAYRAPHLPVKFNAEPLLVTDEASTYLASSPTIEGAARIPEVANRIAALATAQASPDALRETLREFQANPIPHVMASRVTGYDCKPG